MSINPVSTHVFDATEASFQADVIEASFDQPVLVDLWAPWCGPCKTLGPALEKVVNSFQGAVKMAKVDVDTEQQIAAMFGVRSIPTVVLMSGGQPVDHFTGVKTEPELREFIARHVQPIAPVEDIDGDATPEPVESAENAINRLQQEITQQPDNAELKLDLALAHLRSGNSDGVAALLQSLPANLATDDRALRLHAQLAFAEIAGAAPAAADLNARIERDPLDFEARDLLGVRLLLEDQPAAALDQFLAILKADRNWNDGQARKRLIAAFGVLDDAELVGDYRRRMSSLLF